jgi:LysR family transcriptional regulator, nitrogen assimilation regulatory protein
MELGQLRAFARVAQLQSFTKASVALSIAQPALSRQVRALELGLRANLLVRHGRGVHLTPKGQAVLEHAHAVLRQCDQLQATAAADASEVGGHLMLGLPPSFCKLFALPLHQACAKQYPMLQLSIGEGLSSGLLERLRSGSLDCAVLYNAPAGRDVALTPLGHEARWFVSKADRKNNRAAPPKAIAIDELLKQPLVLPTMPNATRQMVESEASKAGLRLKLAAEVDSIDAILAFVAAGVGHAVLPLSALRMNVNAAQVCARPIAGRRLASRVSIATPLRRPDHPAQAAVAAILAKLLLDEKAISAE